MLAPFADGAAQEMFASPFPRVATTEVGGPGTAAGVTPFVIAEASPSPTALTAVILKKYVEPFTRPGTTALVLVETES
jgi:hypothetical protein